MTVMYELLFVYGKLIKKEKIAGHTVHFISYYKVKFIL